MKNVYVVIGVVSCIILACVCIFAMGKNSYAKNIRSFKYTAQQTVDSMGVGWNLGNTFDSAMASYADETYWGQPITTWEMISDIKEEGFKTIRIPVTWTYKTSGAPDYIIDKEWIDRVHEVVTYADEEDLYIIINAHHEGKNIVPTYAKQEECTRMISCIWTQIAEKFEHFGNNLIFETQNEPREEGATHEWSGGTDETKAVVNAYNQAAIEAIRSTGGNNLNRKIMIPGVGASSSEDVLKTIKIPEDDENIIISCHSYSPFSFAFDGNGVTTWGTDSDKQEVDKFMDMLNNLFVSKGHPVVIGEFGTINKNNTNYRVIHARYFTSAARKRGITCVAWDNGNPGTGEETFGHYNRRERDWYFPEIVEAMIEGEAEYAPEVYVEGEDEDYPELINESDPTPTPEPEQANAAEQIQNQNQNQTNTPVTVLPADNTIKQLATISYKITTSNNKKVKKTGGRYNLKKGKSYKIKLVDVNNSVVKNSAKYRSSNRKKASVSKKGKIKALKKGKCNITISGNNFKKITIRIRVK